MAISKGLFLAIFSMDAYNRNYGAGIALNENTIGNSTIKTASCRVRARTHHYRTERTLPASTRACR